MPVALTGLALGISGISGALARFLEIYPGLCRRSYIVFLVIVIFIKDCLHFDQLKKELSHPTLGSFIPTLDMTLMVLAGFIANYYLTLGRILWLIAIAVHVIFCFYLFLPQSKRF